MNPYYTHQQFLINTLNLFNNSNKINILEFGVGEGSSSILNDYAQKNSKIKITSFEHDLNWLIDMKNKYSLSNYTFNHVDWESFDYRELKKYEYDIIFVDQGSWDARITTIDELKNNSKYIILHDYCYYNGFRGAEISERDKEWAFSVNQNTFFYNKYFNDFELLTQTELFPPTLIMKNRKLN